MFKDRILARQQDLNHNYQSLLHPTNQASPENLNRYINVAHPIVPIVPATAVSDPLCILSSSHLSIEAVSLLDRVNS